MKKQILSVFIALLTCAALLAGCGKGNEGIPAAAIEKEPSAVNNQTADNAG